jgi:transposase InsO family protein
MPWLETDPMDQRLRFLEDVRLARLSMTELCAHYQISRKTGYKWIDRAAEEGRRGLADRSRAPHHCPHKMSAELATLLCEFRIKHDDWGARKLLKVLKGRHPRRRDWPAASTVADLFSREGLARRPRRRRPRPDHPGAPAIHTAAPNDLWTADFKGEFRTGDGIYCYPLTIADLHARYLIDCHGRYSTKTVTAWPVFEAAFRAYGLPRAIRTDNGPPFATTSINGLSKLSVWWMRLGIQHQRITPGMPSENGAHERMHRSLKRRAIRPARATMAAQQRAFNAFRAEYNDERPHESLGMETPASQYTSSPRPYPTRVPVPEYPGHFTVKQITTGGTFRFANRVLYLANALTGELVGMDEVDDGVWWIYFGTTLIATLDERNYIIKE